jgi:hypothetical protein
MATHYLDHSGLLKAAMNIADYPIQPGALIHRSKWYHLDLRPKEVLVAL